MMKWHVYILMALLCISCGQEPKPMRYLSGGADDNLTAQTTNGRTPMPCGCSEQSDPVCGANGVNYTNACIANCLSVNYSMGKCEGGTESFCNINSGYVCGQPPMPHCATGLLCNQMMPAPRAYTNECVMMQAGASLIHLGLCY